MHNAVCNSLREHSGTLLAVSEEDARLRRLIQVPAVPYTGREMGFLVTAAIGLSLIGIISL